MVTSNNQGLVYIWQESTFIQLAKIVLHCMTEPISWGWLSLDQKVATLELKVQSPLRHLNCMLSARMKKRINEC